MVVVAGLPNARQLFNAAQAVLSSEAKKIAPVWTKEACESPEPAFQNTQDAPTTHTFQLNLARSVFYDNDVIEGTVLIECTSECQHEQPYFDSRFVGFDLTSPAYSVNNAGNAQKEHIFAELGLFTTCELTCGDGKDKTSHVLYQDYTCLATELQVGKDNADLPIHLPFRVILPSGEPPTLNIANCCISWGVRLVHSEKANKHGVGSKVLLAREFQKASLYKPRAGLVPRAYAERRATSLGGSIRRRSNSTSSNVHSPPAQNPLQRPSSPPLSSPPSVDGAGFSSPLENIAAEYVSVNEETNGDAAISGGLYVRASLSRDVYSIGEPTTVTLWVHHPPGGSTMNPLLKIRKIKASIVQQAQVFVEDAKTLSQEQTLDTSYLPTPHVSSCSWEKAGDGLFSKKFTLMAGSNNEVEEGSTAAQRTRSFGKSSGDHDPHPTALPGPSFANRTSRSAQLSPTSSSTSTVDNTIPHTHRLGLRPFQLDFKNGFTRPRNRADSAPRREIKRSVSCPTGNVPVSSPPPLQKIGAGTLAPTIRKTTIKGRRGSTETTVVSVKYHVEVRVSFYCRADVKLVLPFSLSSALDSATLEADRAHTFSTGPAIPRPATPDRERVELPESEACSTDRRESADRRALFMSLCAQHAPVDHPPPYHRLEGESVSLPPPTADPARKVDPVGFFARPGPIGAFSWFDRTGHESPCVTRLPQPAERANWEPTAEERFFTRSLAGIF